MAGCSENNDWKPSGTSKGTLDSYWEGLCEKVEHYEKEEFKVLQHCTTLTGKKRIQESGRLIGGKTELPAKAPLASNLNLKGIWLAPSTMALPKKSPYGSQRIVFDVKDIMAYLGQNFEQADDTCVPDDDKWNADEELTEACPKGGFYHKGGKKTGKRQREGKKKQVNRKQKDCYLKHKVVEKVKLELPLLFFECAHFYGSTQYMRLILIRATDPNVDWCRDSCKELDIQNNPFFEFRFGHVYTHRSEGMHIDVTIEILVAGDIVLENLGGHADWDVVGKSSRAGYDPQLGVCWTGTKNVLDWD